MAYMHFNGFACLRRAETLAKERLQSRFRDEREKKLKLGLSLLATAIGGG